MNDGSRRLDRLFDLALVILAILSASEFQFVCSIPERQAEIPYAFRILTYPIVALTIVWLVKEVISISWIGHSSLNSINSLKNGKEDQ